jgi:hypothetical protein
MKYSVGDILLIKQFKHKPRGHHRAIYPRPHNLHLQNTLGIITVCENHKDMFQGVSFQGISSENDNCYTWYSQVDNKEYYFYENEVTGEVIV